MTTEPWTTKLPHIIAKGVSDTDIFLVKILTINKTGDTTEIATHIYTAHLIYRAPNVVWLVDDNNNEPLSITATDTDVVLGQLELHDDNDNSFVYIITSCFKYAYDNRRERYSVVDTLTNDIIAYAQTKREAAIIVDNLNKAGIDASFVKSVTRK